VLGSWQTSWLGSLSLGNGTQKEKKKTYELEKVQESRNRSNGRGKKCSVPPTKLGIDWEKRRL